MCIVVGSHEVVKEDKGLMVSMKNMYDFGKWGGRDTCKTGSYAAGIQLKVRYLYSDSSTTWDRSTKHPKFDNWGSNS